MFTYATDGAANALFHFSGSELDPHDLDRYLAAVATLTRPDLVSRDMAAIVFLEDGAPPPPATWRKAMAEATKNLTVRPVRAIVSTSPVTRGISTAISWLRRESPFEAEAVVATFDEAITFIEKHRGPRRAIFERLLAEARAAAGLTNPRGPGSTAPPSSRRR